MDFRISPTYISLFAVYVLLNSVNLLLRAKVYSERVTPYDLGMGVDDDPPDPPNPPPLWGQRFVLLLITAVTIALVVIDNDYSTLNDKKRRIQTCLVVLVVCLTVFAWSTLCHVCRDGCCLFAYGAGLIVVSIVLGHNSVKEHTCCPEYECGVVFEGTHTQCAVRHNPVI